MLPPMHLSAQAAITPSGVPPMPMRRSAPEPGQATEIAPATSPSGMSRMREPASRQAWMIGAWRSRSRMTTVRSDTLLWSWAATALRLSATGASMSMAPAASGPTAILSM